MARPIPRRISADWLLATGFLAIVWLGPASAAESTAPTIDTMLEARELVGRYNPVLLDYLLAEGGERLGEPRSEQARDQLVEALRANLEFDAADQRTAALMTAGAALATALGGNAGQVGRAAHGATFDLLNSWIDSALVLRRAGFDDDAERFFERCLTSYPILELRSRCAVALAASRPAEAVDLLVALLDVPERETVQAALRLLGKLSVSLAEDDPQRQRILDVQVAHTRGLKKATYGAAAIDGLLASRHPAAASVLQPLAEGMMNQDFHAMTRRGLLLVYGDRSVVPRLEKTAGGKRGLVELEPYERLAAGRTLIEAGEAAGYAWAEELLAARASRKGSKFAKRLLSSRKKTVDLRPDVVQILARYGDERAVAVLQSAGSEPGSWLETWIALALLRQGDNSRIAIVRRVLDRTDWPSTTLEAADALADRGDFSGLEALERLYTESLEPSPSRRGRATLELLAGRGREASADRQREEARRIRERYRIAGILADADHADAVPALRRMLGDRHSGVRAAAAYALARQPRAEALDGLLEVLRMSFDDSDVERDPQIKATALRRAASRFGDDPRTTELLRAGSQAEEPSVRFLALVAGR